MHRVQGRTYVGQPGEIVTVSTSVAGGGQASVRVGATPLAGTRFRLPDEPGSAVRMQIALVGPKGASCAVAIAVVDDGEDTDLLLCTTFNPAPVNVYDFSVATAAAMTTLAGARGVPVKVKTRKTVTVDDPVVSPKPPSPRSPTARVTRASARRVRTSSRRTR